MTAPGAGDVARVAAGAALRVPGVVQLDPDLRQSLVGAAAWVRDPRGARDPRPEDGVRAGRAAATGGWHVEVRCALHPHRRCLDTAREVRDRVRSAVDEQLSGHGAPPVTVGVTVIRLVGGSAS